MGPPRPSPLFLSKNRLAQTPSLLLSRAVICVLFFARSPCLPLFSLSKVECVFTACSLCYLLFCMAASSAVSCTLAHGRMPRSNWPLSVAVAVWFGQPLPELSNSHCLLLAWTGKSIQSGRTILSVAEPGFLARLAMQLSAPVVCFVDCSLNSAFCWIFFRPEVATQFNNLTLWGFVEIFDGVWIAQFAPSPTQFYSVWVLLKRLTTYWALYRVIRNQLALTTTYVHKWCANQVFLTIQAIMSPLRGFNSNGLMGWEQYSEYKSQIKPRWTTWFCGHFFPRVIRLSTALHPSFGSKVAWDSYVASLFQP